MASILGNHYIANQWIHGTGQSFVSLNPANNAVLWDGRHATAVEVRNAYQAAVDAVPYWANLTVIERAHYLHNFAKQVELHRQELTTLISQENGKPLWEAAIEVNTVLAKIEQSIHAYAERNAFKTIETKDSNYYLHFKPHGVVAILGAFNFPAHVGNTHIVPALLAGNTILYKPSELTPMVAQKIMQCLHAAELPPGVINCLHGDKTAAQHILNCKIQGVYFTGSYQTGKIIHQFFSSRPEIILALEMGGNNPLVVEEVHDMEAAVYIALISSLITAGQRCTCTRRILIPDSFWGERFLKHLITAYTAITIGPYTANPEPFIGPVISHQHAMQHLQAQDQLIKLGGHPLLTTRLLHDHTGFLSPGIIDMTQVLNPPDQEIFAPFTQIYRYQSFEQAIDLANSTAYGLVASLISDNASHYHKFYQHIHAGLINWNRPTIGANGNLPFGGVGRSGNHRPSASFAADYCSYPVVSQEQPRLFKPDNLFPGIAVY
ncbi:MAG: succinylglutamate-semialdehyde dehydrogenase [Legionellales bacterium RIFCSPHIGHO2_12_FULL_42_9]|nr:MAG: succinylglutamate-semialdehyde dehydrogenase [Legionellales bacterium RIFCSPHIGHO2_12_FULL_42_9]